jgi:hypothetical protein
VLIFVIAGLLYLLRFERVDNLGAYRIPPDIGILIPSVFVNYRQKGQRPASKHLLTRRIAGSKMPASYYSPLFLLSSWGTLIKAPRSYST